MKPTHVTITPNLRTLNGEQPGWTYKLGDVTMARGHLEVVCTPLPAYARCGAIKRYASFSLAWEAGSIVHENGEILEFHIGEEQPE